MSNINLSLDDIISKTKSSKGRGKGSSFKSDAFSARKSEGMKRTHTGGSRTGGSFTKSVPTGKWRNDKFAESESTHVRSNNVRNTNFLESTVNANKKVRVNISNLASSVLTADLEELFSSYSIDSASVHYGENGEHLGTAEVTMKKSEAQKAINDFKGVAIDGSRIVFAIVEGGAGGSIFNRIQIVKKVPSGRIQKRSRDSPQQRRAGGKKPLRGNRHPLDRNDDEETTNVKGGRGKAGKRSNKPQTEEELDAELDSYMTKP